ncbi:hypothetical protein OSTOST_02741 [Ostertagia ostertagi]
MLVYRSGAPKEPVGPGNQWCKAVQGGLTDIDRLRFLSTRLSRKKALERLLDAQGGVITSEKEKAELLADVFHKAHIKSEDVESEDCLEYRGQCGMIWSYDWISVPLVYTQVILEKRSPSRFGSRKSVNSVPSRNAGRSPPQVKLPLAEHNFNYVSRQM